MKKTIIFFILIRFISPASAETQNKWWLAKPMRLIQTNLRDIDADRCIRDVKEYNAEAVMFNIGGIVAFYPTELEYHFRNTYLKNEIVISLLLEQHLSRPCRPAVCNLPLRPHLLCCNNPNRGKQFRAPFHPCGRCIYRVCRVFSGY
jgi:hypothetical protein